MLRIRFRPLPLQSALTVPALCALSLLAGCGGFEGRAGASLLLVTVDTLRADHLGAYGDASTDTPSIDALSAGGLTLLSAHTAAPITTPALGTLLTGRLPRNHGAINNGFDLDGHDPTIAALLAERGYRTAAFLPTFVADKPNFRSGFEVYNCPPLGRPAVPTETLVQMATAWIDDVEEEGTAPWFVWLHALEPHSPYAPPEELRIAAIGADTPRELWEPLSKARFEDRADLDERELEIVRRLYRAEVEAVDAALGPLLARAHEREAGERPLVTALTADHGEMLAEHEDYVGHTSWLFEPMLRIPLIVHFSDGAFAGATSRTPAFGTDLLPTLGRALGLRFESSDGGRDLFRWLDDDEPRMMVAESFAPEGRADQQAVLMGDLKLHRGVLAEGEDWRRAGPAGGFRGIAHPAYPRLFALRSDPGEQRDLAPARPDQVEHLEGLFQLWLRRQRDLDAVPRPALSAAWRTQLEQLGYVQEQPAPASDGGR